MTRLSSYKFPLNRLLTDKTKTICPGLIRRLKMEALPPVSLDEAIKFVLTACLNLSHNVFLICGESELPFIKALS